MSKRTKKTGRPRKSEPTKSEAILIRLEPGEKEAFRESAAISGIPLSSWVRERLRRAAIQELEAVRRPIVFLDNVTME